MNTHTARPRTPKTTTVKTTGGLVPSPYQQAIFDFIESGRGNGVVEAVAGSGKTTTILQSLSYIPKNKAVTFLAFNKDIATVLADRTREMGCDHVDVMTLNAMGLRAWTRLKGTRSTVDANKLGTICRDYKMELEHYYAATLAPENEANWRFVDEFSYQITNLARKAKIAGLVPEGIPGAVGMLADTQENWENLIEHYGMEFADDTTQDIRAINAARIVLHRSVQDHKNIDFDDMFFMPLIYGAPFGKPDFLFVDEAQDVSDIQREILARSMGTHTRLIAVGDPFQSIYGFRGANPDSLALIADKFHAKRLPLSISYRCAKAVVAKAQTVVPHIQANTTAPEGSFTELGEKFLLEDFKSDDMIICRNTAPIIGLAYELISKRIPCVVKGRDIGQGLIKLIEKLNAATPAGLLTKLATWETKEIARLTKNDPDANVSSVLDKAASIRVIVESSKAPRVTDLLQEIRDMFKMGATVSFKDQDKTPTGLLTLSTIHKAKGLEAPRVFILNYHLMPSKMARSPWEMAQETNLQYVAITRAKRDLVTIVREPKKDKG